MSRKEFINYYKILQVDPGADREVIEAAYRRLARMYHPDVNPSRDAEDRMKLLSEAYGVLSDGMRRAEYDRAREAFMRGEAPPRWSSGGAPARTYSSLLRMILIRAVLVGLIVLAMRVNVRLGALLAVVIVFVWLLGGFGGRR